MSGRHSRRAVAGARPHTRLGMGWRQFAADPWVSAALALLVAAVSFLLTATPRALEDVNGRQLTRDMASLSALQRDVTGSWGTTVEWAAGSQDGSAPDLWAPFKEGAERIRSAQPEPLRSMLQDPQLGARVTNQMALTPAEETGYYSATVTPNADPDLEAFVDLVQGEWPSPELQGDPSQDDLRGGDQGGPPATPSEAPPGPQGMGVLVLDESAQKLHLEVGDQLFDNLYLAGTYAPKDAADPRWQHIDNSVTMGILFDPNLGESAHVAAFLSPQSRGMLNMPTAVRMQVWFPLDPAPLLEERVDPGVVRRQLTGMLAQQHTLVAKGDPVLGAVESDQLPAFSTELTQMLDKTVSQQRATSSLLAVVAAGPLGVALAVMALAARLVVHRRRPALALTLARGASPQQVRSLVALEGLFLGVPAAVLGHVLARLVLPGSSRWWEWLVTAVVALAPAATLALSLDDASLLQQRQDLSGRSRSRWRWVAELAVVALAALATWRLLDREGRGDAASETGIDLLAAAAPLLLALAACLVALRLYPLPLAALTSALRGGRGLTPFLGAARALRDPAGGLVPAMAVVLGTSVALISAILLTTVTQGAETASWATNGADVRTRGPVVGDELLAQVEAVPGVAAAARVRDAGNTLEFTQGEGRTQLRVLVVDSALREVLGPDAVVPGPPAALYTSSGPLPVVAGGATEAEPGPAAMRGIQGGAEVVGRMSELPGVHTPGSWVLVDRAAWEAAGRKTPPASTALIATEPGADRAAVAAAVREILPSGVVTTVDEELDAFRTAPVTRGLTAAFVGATVLTGLLTVLAIVVVQLMGSRARMQLLSVLRTLGLAPRQTRALTGWELAPMLVTAMVVGVGLGLLVPWVLVKALDLRGLTGGRAHPELALDPATIGLVLGAVVLTVLIAITVSAWSAGRTNLAQALRVGEER